MLSDRGRGFYAPPHGYLDPLDIMIGRCPTCKSVVECVRSLATPPQRHTPARQRRHGQEEQGSLGAWRELWSVECPCCQAKGTRITDQDGKTEQGSFGPRVYLTKKGKE